MEERIGRWPSNAEERVWQWKMQAGCDETIHATCEYYGADDLANEHAPHDLIANLIGAADFRIIYVRSRIQTSSDHFHPSRYTHYRSSASQLLQGTQSK